MLYKHRFVPGTKGGKVFITVTLVQGSRVPEKRLGSD